MKPGGANRKAVTLRDHLRRATAHSHDRLDASMRPAADWRSPDDYARFLSAQHAARVPVEAWLAQHAPAHLTPPEQTSLLARDLSRLGKRNIPARDSFTLTAYGEASAIGVAWVLAGSSLGNLAMLHDMRRSLPKGTEWPHEFLSSVEMSQFWNSLRSLVEVPAHREQTEAASHAAICVFDHFFNVARANQSATELEGVR
ncbi:biliverdin-producing heme oxygenase [uncultured Erythrobacter sp.]|uniref:biliverdin-producing heme oxygenase n=1 Tax=uncultured Erythrobacter sp. TaxID=263913 RepID=UPI0026160671|nr:biliverdin-producing heme oxygenase [uncultured Erythrobacter sp.]